MGNKTFDESNITVADISSYPAANEGKVTELHLMSFASYILVILALLFLIAGISEFIYPKNSFFETCKVTLPSIAMLVIGYYFGSSK